MQLPLRATFESRDTGEKVAGLIRKTSFEHVQAQLRWRFSKDALDRNWDWLKIWLSTLSAPRDFDCYSVLINDELHALMSLDLIGRQVRGQRHLVVDYLATNPFDRIAGQGFKYLGVCLMAAAVMRSMELGMRGRLWLESLPDPHTLRFYESLGMRRQAQRSQEGYEVFVFEIGTAQAFLSEATNQKWIEPKK